MGLFHRAADRHVVAAEIYVRSRGARSVACAKLHHENNKRCIFCGKPAVTPRTSRRGQDI